MKNIKSLDYYLDSDESRTLESIVATQEITDDELVDKLARKEQVLDLLSNLDDEERNVLELRFALRDNHKHTFSGIGKMMKMSPSKAKETLDRAIRKLKRVALFSKME
jgi:DNA-directed RNA polymerase sigma subunit (sigma70/sigma32)